MEVTYLFDNKNIGDTAERIKKAIEAMPWAMQVAMLDKIGKIEDDATAHYEIVAQFLATYAKAHLQSSMNLLCAVCHAAMAADKFDHRTWAEVRGQEYQTECEGDEEICPLLIALNGAIKQVKRGREGLDAQGDPDIQPGATGDRGSRAGDEGTEAGTDVPAAVASAGQAEETNGEPRDAPGG